jgi:hypothetical protein
MKFLEITKDGGPESTVWAHWLLEIKGLFSIVLLRFEDGSRDAYHSHAFNSVSCVVGGGVLEEQELQGRTHFHWPSLRSVSTHRDTFHRVVSHGRTWVLSVRGPWAKTWQEYIPATATQPAQRVTLTHGRVVEDAH